MKKYAAMILALALCLSAAMAQAFTLTGLETESVPRDWETSLFFPRMEELTGIATTPVSVNEIDEYDKMIAGMLEGTIPAEVLFKSNLTREQEIALLKSGAIIDLAPMIKDNMPNLSALLEAHPEWLEIISLEDGRIPSLPLINQAERQVSVWINTAWLEKLGLEMPQSVEELDQVLRAFKEKDPNGNMKDDEIPLDLLGMFEMRWLLPYFGVIADDYHLARDEQGNIVFAPELPEYREYVAQMAYWYRCGYFGKNAFSSIHNAASLENTDDETVTSGLVVTVAPYTHIAAQDSLYYVPLLMPDEDGNVRWRDLLGEVWTGCFAVTSACKDPAQALAWADALYSEEGAKLGYAGMEGVDYEFGENGKWIFVADGVRSVDDIRTESIMYTGTAMPGISPAAFLDLVDSDIDQHVLMETAKVRAVSTQVTPAYLLDSQAQARADEIAFTLGRLVDEGAARFITGEVEMTDENWNAWLAALNEAGSEELVELFDAADKAQAE